MRNADLHTHSHYSDGLMSPTQLVRLAKKRGIKYLALTDHNSVKGVREAVKEGEKTGVDVFPAVEIRCDIGEILGYFIDINNSELLNELKKIRKNIQESVKDRCKKLTKIGLPVSYSELEKRFKKAKGNLNEFHPLYVLYLKRYGTTMQLRDDISNLMKKNNIRFKKTKEISAVRAIKLIKKAGGVPVLAHPWLEPDSMKVLPKLAKAGLKGIELNNGDRAPFRNPKWNNKIKAAAKKYKLIITSGSDFHGEKIVKLMPGNHNLGKNNCDEKVVENLIKQSPGTM
ncbi:PHP domain-containing protein [Candidatus Woesearchaeota archaeon]|nr:PHP domain-containing protein [Candidatus Woesearchaeota archaeon]